MLLLQAEWSLRLEANLPLNEGKVPLHPESDDNFKLSQDERYMLLRHRAILQHLNSPAKMKCYSELPDGAKEKLKILQKYCHTHPERQGMIRRFAGLSQWGA